MKKIAILMLSFGLVLAIGSKSSASLTKEQSEDIANFAITFIEKGNERRDENGYPLLVYALSSNGQECINIRASGYNEELYYIKNNRYHGKRELGYKWCMDCGDFMAYVYKTTLGFDLVNPQNGDPWHITDFRDDANKGANSKYFEYVYKNVSIASIDETKLMPGDLILRFGSKDNHGLVYIGEHWKQAHASYNAIRYNMNPPITGFQVVNGFYKTSTIISVIRVKDGIVPEDVNVNSFITWPDTGEYEAILSRPGIDYEIEIEEEENEIVNDGQNIIIESIEDSSMDDLSEISYVQEISNNTIVEDNVYDWVTSRIKKILDEYANDDE